jgi:hypothetical protein
MGFRKLIKNIRNLVEAIDLWASSKYYSVTRHVFVPASFLTFFLKGMLVLSLGQEWLDKWSFYIFLGSILVFHVESLLYFFYATFGKIHKFLGTSKFSRFYQGFVFPGVFLMAAFHAAPVLRIWWVLFVFVVGYFVNVWVAALLGLYLRYAKSIFVYDVIPGSRQQSFANFFAEHMPEWIEPEADGWEDFYNNFTFDPLNFSVLNLFIVCNFVREVPFLLIGDVVNNESLSPEKGRQVNHRFPPWNGKKLSGNGLDQKHSSTPVETLRSAMRNHAARGYKGAAVILAGVSIGGSGLGWWISYLSDAQRAEKQNEYLADQNQHLADQNQYLVEQNQHLAEKNKIRRGEWKYNMLQTRHARKCNSINSFFPSCRELAKKLREWETGVKGGSSERKGREEGGFEKGNKKSDSHKS